MPGKELVGNDPATTGDFLYRGSRTYIHSTSLCNYVHRLHPDMSAFALTLKKWMTTVPRCCVGHVEGAHAYVTVVVAQSSREYSFVESDGQVPRSEAFAEDDMDEEYLGTDSQSVSLSSRASHGFTFFDRAICGGKHLIERKYRPSTRLILARFTLLQAIADAMPFVIRTDSHLGERLYKISYHSERATIGEAMYYGT